MFSSMLRMNKDLFLMLSLLFWLDFTVTRTQCLLLFLGKLLIRIFWFWSIWYKIFLLFFIWTEIWQLCLFIYLFSDCALNGYHPGFCAWEVCVSPLSYICSPKGYSVLLRKVLHKLKNNSCLWAVDLSMPWGCLLLTLYSCLETLSLVLGISSHGWQFPTVCSFLVRLIFWFDTFWCTNLTFYFQLQCIIYMYLLAEWFTVKQTRTSGTKK